MKSKGIIFALSLITLSTLPSLSSEPEYIKINNSSSAQHWQESNLTWDQTYYLSKSTESIDETYPIGTQLERSRYNMFATIGVPAGTKYHIYTSQNSIKTGVFEGLAQYTLVLAESPSGALSVVYTARRGEENEQYQRGDGSSYQAFDAQCIFGTAGYEGANQEGNSPPLGNNVAFVWEGGGFGPGFSPEMAIPIGTKLREKQVIQSAKDICKNLNFVQGQWFPTLE